MYQKYLDQETARLLEESGRSEDDEDIDLLVGGAPPFAFLTANCKDYSFSPRESGVVLVCFPARYRWSVSSVFDQPLGLAMYPHTLTWPIRDGNVNVTPVLQQQFLSKHVLSREDGDVRSTW